MFKAGLRAFIATLCGVFRRRQSARSPKKSQNTPFLRTAQTFEVPQALARTTEEISVGLNRSLQGAEDRVGAPYIEGIVFTRHQRCPGPEGQCFWRRERAEGTWETAAVAARSQSERVFLL